ncbi:dioxygenase [Microbacterium sp. EYE_5]|nr:dioxygenase [Microbacterium sp. EYE_382]MCK6085984.1 dioxygenase [Microbacterium sp. EYE_384]MCK6124518.1 dioxygenase [Microbacterium sp. EYE_80]MCK6127427.1 dioxygenase [Microbacterium sp. EYE_79]MCK6141668.1 dioxygenase [Microbacterium sp. EYE_39]MCK6219073.1 dioxygenase [Microbacterium sp. EYE_5]MCK6228169.1 dioxygenase [Microbacterium sp. EYE_77]MCK6247933.1 dioxygenase [Microbacterium sp. EYE_78]
MAMGRSGRGRDSGQQQARARLYEARRRFHESVIARRRRDNVLAGAIGGALILAVLGGQIAYYTLGPGAPEPVPAVSPSPSVSPSPVVSPSPSVAPSPSETATSTPTP